MGAYDLRGGIAARLGTKRFGTGHGQGPGDGPPAYVWGVMLCCARIRPRAGACQTGVRNDCGLIAGYGRGAPAWGRLR